MKPGSGFPDAIKGGGHFTTSMPAGEYLLRLLSDRDVVVLVEAHPRKPTDTSMAVTIAMLIQTLSLVRASFSSIQFALGFMSDLLFPSWSPGSAASSGVLLRSPRSVPSPSTA